MRRRGNTPAACRYVGGADAGALHYEELGDKGGSWDDVHLKTGEYGGSLQVGVDEGRFRGTALADQEHWEEGDVR